MLIQNPLTRNQPRRGYQLLQEAANEGSVDAKVEIAIASLLGIHRQQNVGGASKTLLEHARDGHREAQAVSVLTGCNLCRTAL